MMRRIFCSSGLLLASAAIFAGEVPSVCGAPVTFRFEAEIVDIPQFNSDLGLPFVLQVGKTIIGKMTFDPALGTPVPDSNAARAQEPFPVVFKLDGVDFQIDSYTATAIDDSVLISEEGYSGPAEFLYVDCLWETGSCQPGELFISGGSISVFGRMNFAGIPEIMDSPSFSGDPSVWNAFQLQRNLEIVFVSANGLNSAGLFATVGNFALVPEPSGVLIFCVGLIFDISNRWRTKYNFCLRRGECGIASQYINDKCAQQEETCESNH